MPAQLRQGQRADQFAHPVVATGEPCRDVGQIALPDHRRIMGAHAPQIHLAVVGDDHSALAGGDYIV